MVLHQQNTLYLNDYETVWYEAISCMNNGDPFQHVSESGHYRTTRNRCEQIGESSLTVSMNIVKGGTLTSPTTLTPSNSNFGNATTSVSTTQSSASTISGGTTVASFQLAPGPFAQQFSGRIIVPREVRFQQSLLLRVLRLD